MALRASGNKGDDLEQSRPDGRLRPAARAQPRERRPVFGIGIIERLAFHGYVLSPGTLYPILHGLERDGFLRPATRSRAIDGADLRDHRTRPARADPQQGQVVGAVQGSLREGVESRHGRARREGVARRRGPAPQSRPRRTHRAPPQAGKASTRARGVRARHGMKRNSHVAVIELQPAPVLAPVPRGFPAVLVAAAPQAERAAPRRELRVLRVLGLSVPVPDPAHDGRRLHRRARRGRSPAVAGKRMQLAILLVAGAILLTGNVRYDELAAGLMAGDLAAILDALPQSLAEFWVPRRDRCFVRRLHVSLAEALRTARGHAAQDLPRDQHGREPRHPGLLQVLRLLRRQLCGPARGHSDFMQACRCCASSCRPASASTPSRR